MRSREREERERESWILDDDASFELCLDSRLPLLLAERLRRRPGDPAPLEAAGVVALDPCRGVARHGEAEAGAKALSLLLSVALFFFFRRTKREKEKKNSTLSLLQLSLSLSFSLALVKYRFCF